MKNRILTAVIQSAPTLAAGVLTVIPKGLQYRPLAAVLNTVFSSLVEAGEFDFLQYRWLCLTVSDIGQRWDIGFDGEQFIVRSATSSADVSFSGRANDLVLMASRKEDPDTLFFNRRLIIEGDTELGLALKNLIDSVDIEEFGPLVNQLVDRTGRLAQQYGR
ncbi:hypothetical protein SIN8267_02915 [Sinobacterium norvegicum]|uniref:Ubiquinone biosynthesis accessory factor UbiT n=1 Tax=Sinobacterium norvegicum TaxID=1641715 RepID=A0ABN8EK27_9GAMM|nr:SCP2 sterol-binding domain-containing protein [Sinobacterium norvegicum]CAH0992778.1 hypothetical protein SIN8267_02915 [Sinobacterium norvegicum]